MTKITPGFAILMAMLFLVPGEVLARDDRFEPEYSNNAGPRGEIRVTNDWRDAVRVTVWTHRRERIGDFWVLEPGESAFLAVDEDEDRIRVRPSYKIKVGSDWGWVDVGSVGRFRRGVWYVNVRDIWRATHQREGSRDRYDRYDRYDQYDRQDRYDRYDRQDRQDRQDRYEDVPGGEDRRGGDERRRREGYRRHEDDSQRGGMQPVQPIPPPRSIQPPPTIRPIQPPPTIQPIQSTPTVQPKPAPTIQPIQPPLTVQPKPAPTIQPIQPPLTVQPKPDPREPKRDKPDELQVQQVVPMNGKQ